MSVERRFPPTFCPSCGKLHDAARAHPGHADVRPTPGSIVICVDCGTVCTFNGEMALREMTGEQFEALDAETQTQIRFAIPARMRNLALAIRQDFIKRV